MCGFSGIIDFDKKNDLESNLKRGIDGITHRGPDNQGLYIAKEAGLYFGFNRLKIIDLKDCSNQPFFSDDGSVVMMFNGEIYNYKELKKELVDFEFRTDSDTEILLKCYQKFGLKFLDKIEGMFSICIFDKADDKILLIRDRLGIKPLFFSINQKQILFASEIKSILKMDLIKKEINPTAIDNYLTFLCTIDNQTPFLNVLKLRPGEMMVINLNDKTIAHNQYWDLKIEDNTEREEDIIKNVFKKLDDSIAEQMQSDVDFGCFLSGGLDSSLNAVLMSEKLGVPVKTLSVYFESLKYNEIQYSRTISDQLKATKFEREITQKDFWLFLNEFGHINDNLNGDLVCFPLYFLSEMTNSNGIKMIQVGEGADEIFCGYKRFKYARLIQILDYFWNKTSKFDSRVKKSLVWLAKLLIDKNSMGFEMIRRWENDLPWYFGANNIFTEFEKKNIFDGEFSKSIDKRFSDKIISGHYNSNHSALQKITYLETKLRLPELLLNRVDMLTMNFSIESRVPFLNSKLVEYVFNISDDLKLKNNTTKYLLKKAAFGIIPNEIIDRKKQGFWAPFLEWYMLDKEFNAKIQELILNSKLLKDKVLNTGLVEALLKKPNFNERTILKVWSILILSNFYDYYFAE